MHAIIPQPQLATCGTISSHSIVQMTSNLVKGCRVTSQMMFPRCLANLVCTMHACFVQWNPSRPTSNYLQYKYTWVENYGLIQTKYVLGKAVLGRAYCGKPCTFIATRWFEKWQFVVKLDLSTIYLWFEKWQFVVKTPWVSATLFRIFLHIKWLI